MSIGPMLIRLQATERVINLALTFVFPRNVRLTLEDLEKQQREERKKTIGFFFSELRKRVELDESFDRLLQDFLDYRNTFIHKLQDVPGWDLETEQGTRIAEEFVSRLASLNETVLFSFCGFLRAWQKQVKLDVPIPEGADEIFVQIDRYYTPLIDKVVFKKKL